MIILFDKTGKELGRYDTASDVWYDYPDAVVHSSTAIVEEQPSG